MQNPVIETERLLLRTYVQNDLERVYEIASDPEVRRYFPKGSTINRDDVLASLPRRTEYWRGRGYGQFGVFEKDSGKLIGYCGLKNLEDTDEIEIYYGFARESWGKGYATEAAAAAFRFGFEEAGLDRIVACTHPENFASQTVLQKIGLIRTGDAFHYEMDLFYFALDKGSYRAPRSKYALKWQEGGE